MKDKSKLIAIILVIVTLIVVFISNFINNDEKVDVKEDINIVTNYSNFYTVNSCLYRVTTYLSLQDKEKIYLLLDDNYKSNNNVTEDNVLDLFEDVDSDSTFISKMMYYSKISENLTKYYVKGTVEKNQIYDDEPLDRQKQPEIYFIVYLDSSSKTFSIEPYNGKIFIEGDNYEE